MRRVRLQFVLTTLLAAILAFVTPVFVHRQAFDRAFMNYEKSPTAENEATLRAEKAINGREVLTTHLEAFGLVFALLNVGWTLFRRSTPKSSANA